MPWPRLRSVRDQPWPNRCVCLARCKTLPSPTAVATLKGEPPEGLQSAPPEQGSSGRRQSNELGSLSPPKGERSGGATHPTKASIPLLVPDVLRGAITHRRDRNPARVCFDRARAEIDTGSAAGIIFLTTLSHQADRRGSHCLAAPRTACPHAVTYGNTRTGLKACPGCEQFALVPGVRRT